MKISILIPTKNRKNDLLQAFLSILYQKKLPHEVIIIDQSFNLDSKKSIEKLIEISEIKINVKYIYDTEIRGLVEAKKIGSKNASGEIICFIEDDVILQDDYLLEVERHFMSKPLMLGCCGIATNFPHCSDLYVFFYHLFHRGIFKDSGIHIKRQNSSYLPSEYTFNCNILSGGLSSWRKIVINKVPFDIYNNFHYLEDIDYSTRASYIFGNVFFIIPSIKLVHNYSSINRESLKNIYKNKVTEYLMFFKKRRNNFDSKYFDLIILIIGIFFESIISSFKYFSFKPIFGFYLGLIKGAKQNILYE